jgi:hypothetical protein
MLLSQPYDTGSDLGGTSAVSAVFVPRNDNTVQSQMSPCAAAFNAIGGDVTCADRVY